MFCHFWEKFENSKWPPFLGRGHFFENRKDYIPWIPVGRKISTKSLYRTVKEIEANLCFAIFGKNSKIQNGRHFWGGEFFFKIAKITFLRYPVSRKFRRKCSSLTVKEIEANLCFAIFGKNSKVQNGRHFWGGENCLKIAKITFLRHPVGRKFRRNRSISHG